MYKRILYCFFIAALSVLAGCTADNGPKMPSLKETYKRTDKEPFGANIAYRQLEATYAQNIVQQKKESFDKTWSNISYLDSTSLYVCITPNLYVNDAETSALLDYVSAGNDLFISAAYIDADLLKKIGCKEQYNMLAQIAGFDGMGKTSESTAEKQAAYYSYYYLPLKNYFTDIDSGRIKILGYNEAGNPDFIAGFYGKGRVFMQCNVRAFSNYFLLKDNNYRYMQYALSFTSSHPTHLYWDDYYNRVFYRRNPTDSDFSGFSEISKYPPLLTAFWLGLILLLLFILFNAKRRQRIIKIVKPNENSTVNFTETIGRLYLQKKDNKNVADKMVTYFNEYIRNKYFLNTGNIDAEFITTLSRKSGVDRDRVEILYRTITHAQQNAVLTDYEVLTINESIQDFYKRVK